MMVFDWYTLFFALFALISCVFALAVLLTPDVVRMAFYLILCLGGVAGLFFLAGAEFLGAMQLMIYVGGTLVLLIFGVMLTATSRFLRLRAGGGDWLMALVVGGALFLLLLRSAFMVGDWQETRADTSAGGTPAHQSIDGDRQEVQPDTLTLADSQSTGAIGLALSGVRLDGGSGYVLPFVIVSVHLLVVLVGAAYLARAKRRVDR